MQQASLALRDPCGHTLGIDPNPISLRADVCEVPLIWPTVVALTTDEVEAKKSWIQVATTGTFHSSRYGKFSITKEDLAQMLHNFMHVTPKAPTQLPVDYDHLSMDPKKPGDGKAAGWFEDLELRSEGDELWGNVRWTEVAAEAIANSEYRFVSPTFIKDFVHKTGQKIGTTLLAAAITNHPFLEGMAALTLSTNLGDVAAPTGVDTAVNLAMGYEEKRRRVQAELRDQMGSEDDWSLYVRDLDDESMIYENGDGRLMRRTYAIMDGNVELGATSVEVTMPSPSELPTVGAVSASATDANKGNAMPDNIKLKNANGDEVEVQADKVQEFYDEQMQLARDEATETGKAAGVKEAEDAAAAQTTPEGSMVIEASRLAELETSATQVTALTAQVTTLETEAAAAKKSAHVTALTVELDKLSAAARITKPQRDWAMTAFGEVTQREQFDEWVKTVPEKTVVHLGAHGSADNASPVDAAGDELTSLANAMAKEETISFAEALGRVSAARVDLSERYRQQFATDEQSLPH